MDRIGEAFAWPFRDPKWVEKVVIIGLILLIPIVGGINGLGWMLASLARLREGKNELPPANFDYLGKGLELFVVLLVYSLALLAVAGVFFVPAVILLSTQSGSSGNTALALVGVLLLLIAFGIMLLGLLLSYAVRPAIVLATDRGGISGGFDVAAVLRTLRATPANALIAGLMLLAAGFIGSLGSYACLVGIVFTIPYSLAMEAWIVRSYEVGSKPQEELNVGEPAAPTR
jgi:MFS family permease